MRIGYSDPPYPGCAHLYAAHADYGGEVDHAELIARLEADYDGWLLHTSTTALLTVIAPLVAPLQLAGVPVRLMHWRKPFAAFKRNVPVAYTWEPVLVKACRKPIVSPHVERKFRLVSRDWLEVDAADCSPQELDAIRESITMQRGLTGAKPEKVCHWAFHVLGMLPDDELHDIFPGSGAVTRAWESWKAGQLAEETTA